MPTLKQLIICESVSVDAATNRISYFHVLEDELLFHRFGEISIQIAAVSLWDWDTATETQDFQALLKIYPPGSEGPHEFRINFTFDGKNRRLIQRVYNIPLEQAGNLRFELLVNEILQATHVVAVRSRD